MTYEEATNQLIILKNKGTKFKFNDPRFIELSETILEATKWMESIEPFLSQSKPHAVSINNVTNKQRLAAMREGIYSVNDYPICTECNKNYVLIDNQGHISRFCSKRCGALARKKLSNSQKAIFNDKDKLTALYESHNYNFSSVVEYLGIKGTTLRRQFEKLGIPVSLSHGVSPEWTLLCKDKDKLYQAYLDSRSSTTLLAKHFNISPEAVQAAMHRHNLELVGVRYNNLYDQIRERDSTHCHVYIGKSVESADISKVGVTISPRKRQQSLNGYITMEWISLPIERWKALVIEQYILTSSGIKFRIAESESFEGWTETFSSNNLGIVMEMIDILMRSESYLEELASTY